MAPQVKLQTGTEADNGVTCTTCHKIASQALAIIESDKVEKSVESTLASTVCPTLGNMAPVCIELLPTLVPSAFDKLDELLSTTMCKKFCKKEDDVAYPDANGSTLTCTLCKAEVITIESKLTDKDFIATLESEVEKVCPLIPGQEAVCDGLVEKIVPEAITYILANVGDEDQVCTLAGLCGKKSA